MTPDKIFNYTFIFGGFLLRYKEKDPLFSNLNLVETIIIPFSLWWLDIMQVQYKVCLLSRQAVLSSFDLTRVTVSIDCSKYLSMNVKIHWWNSFVTIVGILSAELEIRGETSQSVPRASRVKPVKTQRGAENSQPALIGLRWQVRTRLKAENFQPVLKCHLGYLRLACEPPECLFHGRIPLL